MLLTFPACELACLCLTVRQALSSRTPCLAHPTRWPWVGAVKPSTSVLNSLYMFRKLGGVVTPTLTLKQRPWACPGPWYGSCPSMTTLTSCMEQVRVQLKTSSGGGNTVSLERSSDKKEASWGDRGWSHTLISWIAYNYYVRIYCLLHTYQNTRPVYYRLQLCTAMNLFKTTCKRYE